MEEINEDPSMPKDLEVKIVATIKEEIIEEVVNDLTEIKLDDCNAQAPTILVGDTEQKFIDFVGVERFDLIINSYLMNIVNCIKIKRQEVQVAQLMSCKYGKKIKGAQYFKYLFAWYGRFQISKMNSRISLFQLEGSDVGYNLLFKFYYLLILVYFYVIFIILGLFISLFLGVFNVA